MVVAYCVVTLKEPLQTREKKGAANVRKRLLLLMHQFAQRVSRDILVQVLALSVPPTVPLALKPTMKIDA